MADTGGLLGDFLSLNDNQKGLLLNVGLGLMNAGARRVGPAGNIGEGMQSGLQNYYAQAQAQQALQQGQVQNQMAQQKMQMLQQAAQQFLGQQDPGQAPQQGAPPPAGVGGPSPQMPQSGPPPGIALPGPPQQAPQQQLPAWLTPPDPAQLRQQPIGGVNPGYYRTMAMVDGKDPLTADKEIQDRQKAEAQQKYAPILSKLQDVAKSDNPLQYLSSDPNLRQVWNQFAPQLGFSKPSDFTDQNVRTAITFAHNQLASSIGSPTLAPNVPLRQGRDEASGLNYEEDPVSGKRTYAPTGPNVITAEQKIQNAQKEREMASQYEKVIDPVTHQPVLMPKAKAAGLQPYNESEYLTGKFTPQMSALMAALAEKGVSLPTGMRSQAQQVSLYQGLVDRNPGKSPDEIAEAVRSGKISLAGDTRAEQAAGATAGKVSYAENELRQSIPLALEASSNVPRGKFVPLNKLMQMANSSISDPDLLDFKIKHQSVMNAYDMLAARSGTDVGKRAAAHAIVDSATSPEAYAKAMKAFEQESLTATKAGRAAMDQMSGKPSVESTKAVHWDDLK